VSAAEKAIRNAAFEEPSAAAVDGFIRNFGRTAATYVESCIHCGMCAEACHFYEATRDPKYTPIWKIEPLKQTYKREYGPFAPLYRLLGLKKKVTAAQLAQWQELIYDSCTLCGRCSLICPMGIDITRLIADAREGMAQAGLAPAELQQAARRARVSGTPSGEPVSAFVQFLKSIADRHGIEVPVDKSKAAVLCTVSSSEVKHYPDAVAALARVMNHLGVDWTFSSRGYEATNAGIVAGDLASQKASNGRLIEAAVACGATEVILPECGHAYAALRWMGANLHGSSLPFRVLHVSEFLAEQVTEGRLKLRPLEDTVTFHDPCQVSRRGGATEAPRVVLQALGVNLREMNPTKGTNWCCGGGGGVVSIQRADPLRQRAFEIKIEQVNATGAQYPVVSCATCRRTFDDGAARHHWDKKARNLLELVAQQLQ